MEAKAIFKELIGQEETGMLRGISLGDPLDKVIALEGNKYEKVISHSAYLMYEKEISATETLQVYYHFKASKKLITHIELYCNCHLYTIYQANYQAKNGNFFTILNQSDAPLTQNFTKVREEFVRHYSAKFGATEEIIDNTLDGLVSIYEWDANGTTIDLQYYLDMNDSIPYTRQILKITVE